MYEQNRKAENNKNLLKFATIRERFFNNNEEELHQAVAHFNHKIVSVTIMTKKMDVYDIEVPNTHNFALGSGVLLHRQRQNGKRPKISGYSSPQR